MEQKNKENIFLDEPSGELTFGKIFKILKYSLLRMLVYVIIACILGGCISIALTVTAPTTKSISTSISFDYGGISQGLTPNGDKFKIDSIKDTAILNDAINMLGKDGNGALNVNNLHSNIHISEVIPADILAIRKDLESENNKEPDKNEQLQKLEYHSNKFIIYLDNHESLGLSDNEAVTLLNNIISVYQKKWTNDFINSKEVSSTVLDFIAANGTAKMDDGTTTTMKNDFIQYEYILRNEIDSLKEFLEENKDIKHSYNNNTFASLLKEVKALETNYQNYVTFIKANKITNNHTLLASILDNEVKSLTIKNQSLLAEIEQIKLAIKEMQPSSELVPNTENILTSYPYQYWAIQQDLIKKIEEQAECQKNLEIVKENKTAMQGAIASSEEDIAMAEAMLKDTAKDFARVANKAQELSNDYKTFVTLNDAITTSLPATIYYGGGVNKLEIILSFVLPILVAVVAAIIVTVKLQKKFAFKALAAKKNVEEAKVLDSTSDEDTKVDDTKPSEDDKDIDKE